MQKLWMSSFALAILVLSPAIAVGNSFETNSSGIIDKLMAAPATEMQPIYKTRGLSQPKQQEDYKIRGLRLEKRSDGTREYKPIEINKSDRDRASKVNLEIRFDVNSARLRPKSIPLLDELAKALKDPRLLTNSYFINGHTDSDGSDEHNLKLSLERADSVRQYLVQNHNIDDGR
ncbi:MAG: OmpA family protein, partial [Pseudomonadota bacterium]|nr:OmpA family protein [Pseudomonadota bacterium]